jgi:hypothetical protein
MSQPADDRSIAPWPSTLQQIPWQAWFAEGVRFGLAPLILLLSGFFTADFLLSGAYTWPRTSRVLVLTITVAILSYEFVYKEQAARGMVHPLKALLYSCLVPYGVGVLALAALVQLAS